MSGVLQNPRDYVESYFTIKGIKVNARGNLISSENKNIIDVFRSMYLDYMEQVELHNKDQLSKPKDERYNVKPLSETRLQYAFDEFILEKKLQFKMQAIASVKCEVEDLNPLRTMITAMTGKDDPDALAVLSHWIWSVKQKMAGKPVVYHIMPIFFGAQGSGKTVTINRLIEPLENFRLNISLEQMTDDRYFKTMSENFVAVFDEMQGATRSDVDALKKQITTDMNDYRILGTNTVQSVKQACSFIGATNRHINDQIFDSSGMRRFYQIDVLQKTDWKVLSELDYLSIWKGVDENKEKGYIVARLDSIQEAQNELIAKDEFFFFFEEYQIMAPTSKDQEKEVTTLDLYREYTTFCIRNGINAKSRFVFSRKLTHAGIVEIIKKIDGKTTRCRKVDSKIILSYNDHKDKVISLRS